MSHSPSTPARLDDEFPDPSNGRAEANAGNPKRPAGAAGKSQTDRTPAATAPRKGGGFFSYLIAGIIGGAITAGGGYAAMTAGLVNVGGGNESDIQRLENRMVELDRAIQSEHGSQGVSAFSASPDTNELRARLDSLVEATRTLTSRVDAVERRGSDTGTQSAAVSDLTRRLSVLEQTLETANKTQSERQVETRSAALSLALSNLKRAVAEGRPFAGELASVSNLAGVKLSLEQIAKFKDTGVTTLVNLQNDFPALSHKAIEQHYRGTGGTIVGEVFSRAKAAIQVKSADGTGTTIEAIMGRMDAALKAGNLSGVLVEGQTLQGPALEVMQPWLAKVEARVATEEALRKTDQELLAALTKTGARR